MTRAPKDRVTCGDCGMTLVSAGEYHPYAACLMYRQCGREGEVRENLLGVVEHGVKSTKNQGLSPVVYPWSYIYMEIEDYLEAVRLVIACSEAVQHSEEVKYWRNVEDGLVRLYDDSKLRELEHTGGTFGSRNTTTKPRTTN